MFVFTTSCNDCLSRLPRGTFATIYYGIIFYEYYGTATKSLTQLFFDMNAGVSCHPMMATLLNIEHGIRIKNLKHVGYFPIVSNNNQWPEATFRLIKLTVYSKVLDAILAPMKKASKESESLLIDLTNVYNTFWSVIIHVACFGNCHKSDVFDET